MIRYEMNHLTLNFADDLPHSAEEIQAYHDHAIKTHPTASHRVPPRSRD